MKTITLALYSLYGTGEIAKEFSDWLDEDRDYVRLTEPQEITFIERDHVDVVFEQVDALKKQRDQVRAELAEKVAQIDERIQNLMAIEHSTTDEA